MTEELENLKESYTHYLEALKRLSFMKRDKIRQLIKNYREHGKSI